MACRKACSVTAIAAIAAFFLLCLPPACAGDEYRVTVSNRMAANMHMSCRAVSGGASGGGEFFHSFRADPGRDEELPPVRTQPGRSPFRLTCKWAYDGNYMKGVTLFSTRWPEAPSCSGAAGGCAVVFENREMRIVPAEGAGRVLGDLPVIQCETVYVFFRARCWYPEHHHQYAGRILPNLAEYVMA